MFQFSRKKTAQQQPSAAKEMTGMKPEPETNFRNAIQAAIERQPGLSTATRKFMVLNNVLKREDEIKSGKMNLQQAVKQETEKIMKEGW